MSEMQSHSRLGIPKLNEEQIDRSFELRLPRAAKIRGRCTNIHILDTFKIIVMEIGKSKKVIKGKICVLIFFVWLE